jgi:hypothetical protein
VGVNGRFRSLDSVPEIAQVTHSALGGHQLLVFVASTCRSLSVSRADRGFLTVHLMLVLVVIWLWGGVLEGGECRLRASQSLLSDVHLCSNPLGLAVHDNFHVVLVLGLCHGNPLGLGVLGLGGDDLGDSGGGVQRSASTAAPPLVLLSDDSGADVEDCLLSISSN